MSGDYIVGLPALSPSNSIEEDPKCREQRESTSRDTYDRAFSRSEKAILGEVHIPPGHPLVILWVALNIGVPNNSAKAEEYILINNEIPGSVEAVREAVLLLKEYLNIREITTKMKSQADTWWEEHQKDEDLKIRGQKQADRIFQVYTSGKQ